MDSSLVKLLNLLDEETDTYKNVFSPNKLMVNRKKTLVVLGVLFVCLSALSSTPSGEPSGISKSSLELGLPMFRTFPQSEYGENANNWSLVQTADGMIYIGNGNGVLEYDGINWRLFPVNNGTLVRSLAVDSASGRIYVGAVGELGYLADNGKGEMQYVSLVSKIPEKDRSFADVWQTFITDKGVVFSTFSRIFRINNDGVESWAPKNKFHFSFQVGKRIITRDVGIGLVELLDGKLQPLPGGQAFSDERVYGLMSWPDLGDSGLLIVSRTQGLFLYDGTQAKRFPTEIDDELIRGLLYSALKLPDGRIALGTLQNGLYFIDHRGHWLGKLDQELGLQANSVTSLMLDQEGGLWLTLMSGLARAEVTQPLTLFHRSTGLIGDVMSMINFDDTLFVGTGDGLLKLEKGPVARFNPVSGFKNQIWDLLVFDDRLLVSGYLGFYEYRNNVVRSIYEEDTVFYMSKDRHDNNRLYLGARNGVLIFRLKNDSWVNEGLIQGIKGEVREIIQDTNGDLWGSTYANGIFQVMFTANEKPTVQYFGENKGIRYENGNDLSTIGNEVVALSREGVHRFIREENRFVKHERFESIFSEAERPVFDLIDEPSQGTWLITALPGTNRNESGLAKLMPNGETVWMPQAFKGMTVGEPSDMYRDPKGILWLAGVEGLYRFDPNLPKDYSQGFQIKLRQVQTGEGVSLYNGAGKPDYFEVPFKENRLRFEFAALSFDSIGMNQYQVKLIGEDTNWSPWRLESFKDYSNLWEGNYSLHVRAKNRFGTLVESEVLSFRVLPPWYRTIFA